jgi:predicted enzyme involved in methoxymalonyl-ACP biosynthesis
MTCRQPYLHFLEQAQLPLLPSKTETLKIALLVDSLVEQIIPQLQALFSQRYFAAEIIVAVLDGPELRDFHPASALFAFKPHLIIVLNSLQSLRDQYYQHAGYPAEFLNEHRSRMTRVWTYIQDNSTALVIQANFADPIERIYEQYSLQLSCSLPRIVTRLNGFISLQIENREHIRLLDIHQIAAAAGLQKWYAETTPESARAFCATEYLALVATHILDIYMSAQDDGLEGVNLALDGLIWDSIIREEACTSEPEDFFSRNYPQLLNNFDYPI